MMTKSKEEMKGCYFVVVLGRKALKRRIEGLGMSKKRTGGGNGELFKAVAEALV